LLALGFAFLTISDSLLPVGAALFGNVSQDFRQELLLGHRCRLFSAPGVFSRAYLGIEQNFHHLRSC
jgi:hypothetical protein